MNERWNEQTNERWGSRFNRDARACKEEFCSRIITDVLKGALPLKHQLWIVYKDCHKASRLTNLFMSLCRSVGRFVGMLVCLTLRQRISGSQWEEEGEEAGNKEENKRHQENRICKMHVRDYAWVRVWKCESMQVSEYASESLLAFASVRSHRLDLYLRENKPRDETGNFSNKNIRKLFFVAAQTRR